VSNKFVSQAGKRQNYRLYFDLTMVISRKAPKVFLTLFASWRICVRIYIAGQKYLISKQYEKNNLDLVSRLVWIHHFIGVDDLIEVLSTDIAQF
jgi:hypothetical protein